MKRRLLSIFLVIAMLLGNLQMFSFMASGADVSGSDQIVNVGSWNPADYESKGTLYEDKAAVKKSISPTDKENYFDINLEIAVNPAMFGQSVDVVVVMDISNTMNDSSRLKNAKAAIKQFVSSFADNDSISGDRNFSLVTFNSDVTNLIPFTPLVKTSQANAINSIVDGITAPGGDRRYTNIEGGLKMAHNIMKSSDAVYKYVILVTDGMPTTYIDKTSSDIDSTTSLIGYYPIMSSSTYDKSRINEDGYFCNSVKKKSVDSGIIYSDIGAQRAETVANEIKSDRINIFSVGINIDDSYNLNSYHNSNKSDRIDTRTSDFAVGGTQDGYRAWLGNDIAGGPNMTSTKYVDGDNANGLKAAFTTILEQMEEVTVEFSTKAAYTVDPMSQYVEFMNFFDAQGASQAIIQNSNGVDVATFDNSNDTIRWLLENDEPSGTDANGNLIYNLKYRVRLKTDADDFDFSKAVATNNTTTLHFKTEATDGTSEEYDIEYTLPEVKGFKADVVFTKTDEETKKPIEGVEFKLSHNANCSVCGGEVTIADTFATSDANGTVQFPEALSGHKYTLTETSTPAGYQAPEKTFEVSVDYGVVTIDGNVSDANNPVTITNKPIASVEFKIDSNVQLVGRDIKTEEFKMSLENKSENIKFSETFANDSDGNAQFSTIKINEPGIYILKGKQVIGDDPTVIYDENEYDIVLNVTLNDDGTAYVLETTIDGNAVENDSNPDPLKYVNKIRGAAKPVLKATKLLDGVAPKDGEFEFVLKDVSGETIQTVKNVGSEITFKDLSFDNVGTYKYKLSEVKGNTKNVYYDSTVYDVTIKVTKPADKEGDFDASVEYSVEGKTVVEAVFNNETIKPVEAVITSHVDLIGRDRKTGEFEMTLTGDDYVETYANDKDGNASYKAFAFNEVGTYTYKGYQIIGDDDTVIYDTTEYEVVFKVTLNEKGNAYVLETTINGESVDNDKAPAPLLYVNRIRGNASAQLRAIKLLDGEAPANGKFTFELKDVDGNVIETATNVGSDVKFKTLTYSTAGTHNYTINEVNSGEKNIYYDDVVYDVTVTVSKPEKNAGDFEAAVVYSVKGDVKNNATFNNKTIKPVEVIIKSHTDIEGRELKNEEFDMFFNTETIPNDKDGNATYEKLTFDTPGVYSYTGYQIEGDDPTVIYDKKQYNVVFNVELNEKGDVLVLTTTINGEDVENDNEPDPLEYLNKIRGEVEVTLSGLKYLDGKTPEDGDFTFQLKDKDGKVLQTVQNVGSDITFKSMTYDNVGTYNYTISEVAGDDYIVYDKTVYDVKVTVTEPEDDSDFVADVKYSLNGEEVETPIFNNTTIKPAEVIIKSHTDIEGRPLKENEFDMFFNEETKSNDKDGNADYKKLTFDKEGTYTYNGYQVKGDDPTVIYDKTTYEVVVKVTLNDTRDAFVVETTINGEPVENDNAPQPLEYLNRLRGDASQTFKAKKFVDGKTPEQKFTFQLKDENGKVIQTAENNGSSISFEKITYKSVGTYNYTISEVAGEDKYIVYDDTVYNVTVTVTQPEEADGDLVSTVKYTLDGKTVDNIVFNNKTVQPVKVVITSHTDIEGRPLKENEFDMFFNEETIPNDKDGNAEYKEIVFEREGVYSYNGYQVEGVDPTVIYDKKQYNVVFNVKFNETGDALVVETTINGEEVENDNAPDPLEYLNKIRGNAEAYLSAIKFLDGDTPEDGQFTFRLKEKDGNVLQTVANVGTDVIFDTLKYDNVGTHYYTISEVAGDDYIVYDKTVYDVKVTVTEPGDDSNFVAEVEYSVNGTIADMAQFNNTTIKPAEVVIKSHTDIEGRDLKENEFDMFFNEETKPNDKDGNADYKKLSFDKEGTYTYNGYQVVGDDPTVIYDKTKYEVVVKVTLNEDRDAFVVETTINGEPVENDNAPKPLEYLNRLRGNANVELSAIKYLDGKKPEDGQFTFQLKDKEGEVLQTVKNNGSAVNFKALSYNTAGTYNYTISEVAGDDYIVYDKTEYDVTVTVTKPESADGDFVADVKYSLDGEEVETAVFNNTTIAPVTVTVKSHTDIEGRDLKENEFDMFFNEETNPNDKDGNAQYKEIVFDKEGTFTFDGYQVEGDDPTVIYDKTEYKVVVKVTLNETRDAFVVETTINGNPVENDLTPDPLEYLNKIRGNAEVVLEGIKYLDGKKPEDGQFTFQLKDKDDKVLQTVKNVGSDIKFESMTYDNVGTHKYTISEVAGEDYIVYDKNVYDVTVTVTEPEDDSNFIADVKYSLNGKETEAAVFNNTTIAPAEVVIKSHTDIEGRDLKENEFDMFFNEETKSNDKEGNADYKKLTFDKVGTYTYSGYQVEGADPTVIYDKTTYEVVVKVTLNEARDAFVVETTINGEEVENDNAPKPLEYLNKIRDNAKVVLSAIKYLDSETPEDGQFTFELKDKDGEVIQTVENVGSDVTFAEIQYNNVGTYNYTISEVAGEDYIVYDKNVYDVTVTVTEPEDDGAFVADVKYSLNGEDVETAVFNNTTIAPVTVTVKSHTDIEGRDLKENEFDMFFNEETNPNDKDGNAQYKEIVFDKEGTFTFDGYQVEGDDPTVIYDKTEYKVVVKVTLNETRDAFVVETTINGNPVENDLTPDPLEYLNKIRGNANVVLEGIKYLDGETPADGQFTFELKDENGEVLQTVNNVGSDIKFESMTYDNVGTHKYTISEVKGTEYIVYDKTVYDVTVTITEPEDDSDFVATVVYSTGENTVENAVFNNTTIKPVEVTITSNTVLIGRDRETGEFKMTLADGVEYTETYGNDENGNAVYSKFTFSKEGTYTFTGHQEKGDDPTVIYADNTYTVVFNVTLNDEGTEFVLETTINGEPVENDSAPEPLKYENRIRGNADVTFTAVKLLDGKAPEDGLFTFELKDEEGNVVKTAKNVGSDVTFDGMSFSNVGTYKFTISELAGKDSGIKYDTAVYDVTVTVTEPEDNEGAFDATVEYSLDGETVEEMEFNNETIPAKKAPQTGDTSNLFLWLALLVISGGIGAYVIKSNKKSKS